MKFYDPIAEFIRDNRLEQPDCPPAASVLREQIRRAHGFVVLLSPQDGPRWVFGDEASLILDGRLARPLHIQLAALGGYDALTTLAAPDPYVGFYLDIAALPARLPVGGSHLLVRLPAVVAWDVARYLGLAPAWGDEVAEELKRALSRLPFLAPKAIDPETGRLDEKLLLSSWAELALTDVMDKGGIPLRFALIEGLPPPPLPPVRDSRDLFRRSLEEQVCGQGVHSRKARRRFVPLQEHDAPMEHEMVDALALRQAIEELPQHLREAIFLVYIEGLTQQEAARRVGVSQQALSKRLQQAVRLLKATLS